MIQGSNSTADTTAEGISRGSSSTERSAEPVEPHTSLTRGVPKAMAEREDSFIETRRRLAGVPLDARRVGLALSGGGIRSATFNLGLLQALAGRDFRSGESEDNKGPNGSPSPTPLQRVDYLSTVSGGGYIGGFLGQLYCRIGVGVAGVMQTLVATTSAPIAYLRENGRYLSPNGGGDLWVAVATMLRSWFALQGVMSLFFAIPFLVWILVRAAFVFEWEAADPRWLQGLYFSPLVLAPALVLLLWTIPAGIAYWFVPGPRDRVRRLGPWGVIAILLCVEASIAALGYLAPQYEWPHFDLSWTYGALGAGLLTVLAALFWIAAGKSKDAAEPAARRRLSNWLTAGLSTSVGIFAFALADASGQTAYVLIRENGLVPSLVSMVAVVILPVIASGQKLLSLLPAGPKQTRLRLPITAIATVAASVLGFAWLTSISALCYALAWKGQSVETAAACRLVAEPALRDPTLCCHCAKSLHGLVTPSACAIAGDYGVPDWVPVAVVLGLAGVFSWIFGHFVTFVNQSSQANLYSARLTRAYLGASNPKRHEGTSAALTQVIDGDDRTIPEYTPHRFGGPLHFINLTLNETMDGRSQIEQRDRKGLPLAIGPAGISVGVRHHALALLDPPSTNGGSSDERAAKSKSTRHATQIYEPLPLVIPDPLAVTAFRVFQPKGLESNIKTEALSLGRWIGISGAAVSTGLGSRTSLGFSFLCGFFNLRLGHWWWSGTEPASRSVSKRLSWFRRFLSRNFPVQVHLLHEFLARFPGTQSRYWYLSDGGHFENTGTYELIRRRVPLIIVSDAGADESCEFIDLGALVRKARLDFHAEITFLTGAELDDALTPEARRYVGTLEELRGTAGDDCPRRVGAYAALAQVRYDGHRTADSLLLYVKPGLLNDGHEPADVKQYATLNPAFPHESTGDQFFDEAQWESYRCLGEHIGRSVLCQTEAADVGRRWHPAMLWSDSTDAVGEALRHFQTLRASPVEPSAL
jgi:hypothetical protein